MLKKLSRAVADVVTPDPLESLHSKLSAARTVLTGAEASFDAAAVTAELSDDPAAADARDVAGRDAAKARGRVRQLEGALRAAEADAARRAKDAAAADVARRWGELDRHAAARLRAARDYEAAIAAAAEALARVEDATAAIYAAVPVADTDGALLRQGIIASVARLTAHKAGMSWAQGAWPWGADTIETLVPRIEAGNARLFAQRPK